MGCGSWRNPFFLFSLQHVENARWILELFPRGCFCAHILCLSILVTPCEHLNIFNLATSSFSLETVLLSPYPKEVLVLLPSCQSFLLLSLLIFNRWFLHTLLSTLPELPSSLFFTPYCFGQLSQVFKVLCLLHLFHCNSSFLKYFDTHICIDINTAYILINAW